MFTLRYVILYLCVLYLKNPLIVVVGSLPDATFDVFGENNKDIFPVAFGDYDSDKLTDVVVLKKKFSSFDIYFGASNPPLLSTRKGFYCDLVFMNKNKTQLPIQINGLQLADFTGDGVTDICVTFVLKGEEQKQSYVTIFKGNVNGLDCQNSVLQLSKSSLYLQMKQEPLIVDINGDMIADLVGEDTNGKRKFWTFYKDENPSVEEIDFPCNPSPCLPFANPNANGFVDIDGDFAPELIMISQNITDKSKSYFYIEIFSVEETYGRPHVRFEKKIELSTGDTAISRLGNPVFMDINLRGTLAQIIPYCSNLKCHDSGFLIIENDKVSKLDVKFQDNAGNQWGFFIPQMNTLYSGTISVRVGDFNLDGYPDLVGTLMMVHKSLSQSVTRPVIFKNVPCNDNICRHPRTFQADFELLQKHNGSISTAFFDVHEDGLLDIMIVRRISGRPGSTETFGVFLDKNKSEYDAYFIKWILTSGLCDTNCPSYGVRAPGATMVYNTTDLNSKLQSSRASQIYRTHFAMDLPYTVMGTGTSPNFIDAVTFGLSKTKINTRFQIIPNSILIVIPPSPGGYKWQIKHLLTPSVDGAVSTFHVLLLICLVNGSVVFYFWMKERKEDRMDRRNSPLIMSGLSFT